MELQGGSSSAQLESLSAESRERIAALRKARRERSVEHQVRRDSPHTSVVAFSEVTEGETVGREALITAEQKAFDVFMRQSAELRKDAKRSMIAHQEKMAAVQSWEKETKRAQQALLRESFRNFWSARKLQQGSRTDGASNGQASMDDLTRLLNVAYAPCMMPFATDPEECWRRGVTVPPDAQQPMHVELPSGRTATIPTYASMGQTLLHRYEAASKLTPSLDCAPQR